MFLRCAGKRAAEKVKVGSLFSGIGGFDLALERAGMTVLWQVENDKNCNAVLKKHWPEVTRHGDIAGIAGEELKAVDLVCGGFPCQDLSVAGKRAGLAGERSGLWFEFHRIIAKLSPRWVLIENVPGLRSSPPGRRGEDFAVILSGLVKLGYGVAWRSLDAQYFHLAQRRERVFIVGHFGSRSRAAEILFEPESVCRDTPPGREEGEEAPAYAIRRAQTSSHGWGISDKAHSLDSAGSVDAVCFGGNRTSGPIDIATACKRGTHGDFETETFIFEPRYYTRGAGGSGADEVVPALQATSPKSDKAPVVCFSNCQSTREAGDISPTLLERMGTGGNQVPCVMGTMNYGVRRLTPLECERLQGFPDGWTEGASDSARYRMLGNAVAVPVAEWIGRRIMGLEAPERPVEAQKGRRR